MTDQFQLRCGCCGVLSDLDNWLRTPINGPLPDGVYQCPNPACRRAIRRIIGPPTIYENGFRVPGEVKLIPAPSVL